MRRTVIGVAALTGVATALSGVGIANASSSGDDAAARNVYASGLAFPQGMDTLGRKSFVVAESGANRVTIVGKRGGKRVLLSGAAVSGVTQRGKYVFSVVGGPNEQGAPPPGRFKQTSVLRTKLSNGKTKVMANLEKYELAHNPDGQVQFSPQGQPYDALSNPYSVTSTSVGLLVADGGANDVLKVNPRTGKVSTFFVPPTVKPSEAPACGGPQSQGNPGTVGCDSVPTGVFQKGRSIYVSTLGAFAPGAGRIYKLNLRGKVQRVWKGLFAPVGIAVGNDGSVYYGAFATNQVARIHKGKTTHVPLAAPTALTVRRGALYGLSGQNGTITRLWKGAFK